MFTVEPLTENCRRILDQGVHVLIGISPGNSYFSEQRITDLLRWAAHAFRRIDVIIPDAAEVETRLALGYPEDQAHRKARGSANRIRNRAVRACITAGVPTDRTRILLLSDIAKRPDYQAARWRCEEGLADDPELREICLRPARHILRTHLKGREPTAEQTERAMGYLLAEMPLMLDTPGLLCVESSSLIYHQHMEFFDRIVLGKSPLSMSERQAFVVVRPAGARSSEEPG